MVTLEELQDRITLTQMQARYAQGVDRIDPSLALPMFTEDVVFGPAKGAKNYGIGSVRRIVEALVRYDSTHHAMGNVYFAFHHGSLGGERGEMETYAVAVESYARAGARVDHVMMIRYRDRLVKGSGRWQVAERIIHHDWVQEAPPPEDNVSRRGRRE